MKRRFLYLGLVLALFVPILSATYNPQPASAAVGGTGNNLLQLVGEHCHDLNDIKHDFGIGSNVPDGKGACHEDQGVVTQGGLGWEEVLANSLNCSTDMFYQHPFTDPNDPSITTKTLWYTHIGEYKDCYNKAQNMFNNMTDTSSKGQCVLAGEGSQNYTNCLADVTNLHDALGCSTNMLQKTNRKDSQGNFYYTVDPNSGAAKDCQQRIDDVGKIKIVVFDGNGNTIQSPAISDPSVTVNTPDSPNGGQGQDDNSCEASGGGFSLNWALCEVYQGVQAVVNWMFGSVIEPLLVTTPICLPGNSSCDDTIYTIWSHFRVYGDIFLVITLLVIVFGESIGGGMIEAYTAKKVLPRLLAAAILLNLSIYIMGFCVDLTNIVGGGIGQLLTGPLNGQGLFTIHPGNITAGAIFAGAGGVALLAGFTVVNVTGIALLAVGLAITGLIAVLAVFFTLIIRQAIIIGLVLVSPVAFALWCLPNTERWFKRWWDTFFQMLLVYPMVVVLFAVADIMSYLTAHNGNGGSFANNVVAFMLLLIPLYLVPFTLRSSNRLMGAIQGAASNVGRQINAISGRRALAGASQEFGTNIRKTFAGDRWQGNNIGARAVNRIGGGLGVGYKGRFGFGSRGRGALDLKRRASSAEAQKSNAELQQLAFDDNAVAVLAASGGTTAGARRAAQLMGLSDEETRRAVGTAQSVGFNATNVAAAIDLMAQNKSRAFNNDNGLAGQAGVDLIRESAARISGGNEQMTENMVGAYAFHSRNAGRLDLGGEGPGGSLAAGWNRAGVAQHAQAFGASTQHYMDEFAQILNDPANHTNEERAAAAIAFSEMHNAMPNATGENQTHINNAMEAIGIDTGSGVAIEEQLANIANAGINGNDIRNRARQYGSAVPPGVHGAPPAGGGGGAGAGGAGGGAGGAASDRRLKRSIVYLRTTYDGIALYKFQYLWSDQAYVGVMAQDLVSTHPEALSIDHNGYYMVDYSMLGLEMLTIEEWTGRQPSISSNTRA